MSKKTAVRSGEPTVAPGLVTISICCLSVILLVGTAAAHVALDSPNGGERLEVGSPEVIEWHDSVDHGPATYDLWYSVTGPDGPWIDIASGLGRVEGERIRTYEWTVPDAPSESVRIRVLQDNTNDQPYTDISDEDLEIFSTSATSNTEIQLGPSQDATMYEGDGSLANGAGSFLFTGRTDDRNGGGLERRAFIAFDIAGNIPAGSTITKASLQVFMSRTIAGDEEFGLNRVLESWSEGSSDAPGQEGGGAQSQAGDLTWVHRTFPDSLWSTPGGSFATTVSSSQTVGDSDTYTFASTPETVADVQGWLDQPTSNFGWALVMPSPGIGSAKRFNSSENTGLTSRPTLIVSYEEPQEVLTSDFDFSPQAPLAGAQVSFTDTSTGGPTAWLWQFGDGESSTQQNPTHVFTNPGDFVVSLTVSEDDESESTQQTVTVLPEEEPEMTELVIIPAAGVGPGAGTSQWVTTVDVHNRGSDSAHFTLLWFPRETDNADAEHFGMYSLEPGETIRFPDVVGEEIGRTSAFGAAGVLSDSAEVEAMSRISNQSANGTFGQSLAGVPEDELTAAGTRARILFLTEDGSLRSNLGLINGVAIPIVVQWELFDSSGNLLDAGDVDLPPYGNVQLNRVLADVAPIEAAYADVWTSTSGGAFTSYGSVLDELTDDPTTVLPR